MATLWLILTLSAGQATGIPIITKLDMMAFRDMDACADYLGKNAVQLAKSASDHTGASLFYGRRILGLNLECKVS